VFRKKGELNTPSACPFFKKETAALNFVISKPPFRCYAHCPLNNGFVFVVKPVSNRIARVVIIKKEPITVISLTVIGSASVRLAL